MQASRSAKLRRPPTNPTAEREGPQAFRWSLTGGRLPPLTAALRLGEAARAAVYRAADARGLMPLPNGFHRGADAGHTHAFWLPEDADDDGLVDHILLFAESGLPERLLPALAEGGVIRLADLGRWRMVPDWMGRRAPGDSLFGPARYWVTATPFVTPLWRGRRGGGKEREGRGPYDQLRDEILSRNLPAALVQAGIGPLIVRAGHSLPARQFTLAGRGRTPPGDAAAVGAAIVFAEPVWGPLAFGFGAHFGLGLFEPADRHLLAQELALVDEIDESLE